MLISGEIKIPINLIYNMKKINEEKNIKYIKKNSFFFKYLNVTMYVLSICKNSFNTNNLIYKNKS